MDRHRERGARDGARDRQVERRVDGRQNARHHGQVCCDPGAGDVDVHQVHPDHPGQHGVVERVQRGDEARSPEAPGVHWLPELVQHPHSTLPHLADAVGRGRRDGQVPIEQHEVGAGAGGDPTAVVARDLRGRAAGRGGQRVGAIETGPFERPDLVVEVARRGPAGRREVGPRGDRHPRSVRPPHGVEHRRDRRVLEPRLVEEAQRRGPPGAACGHLGKQRAVGGDGEPVFEPVHPHPDHRERLRLRHHVGVDRQTAGVGLADDRLHEVEPRQRQGTRGALVPQRVAGVVHDLDHVHPRLRQRGDLRPGRLGGVVEEDHRLFDQIVVAHVEGADRMATGRGEQRTAREVRRSGEGPVRQRLAEPRDPVPGGPEVDHRDHAVGQQVEPLVAHPGHIFLGNPAPAETLGVEDLVHRHRPEVEVTVDQARGQRGVGGDDVRGAAGFTELDHHAPVDHDPAWPEEPLPVEHLTDLEHQRGQPAPPRPIPTSGPQSEPSQRPTRGSHSVDARQDPRGASSGVHGRRGTTLRDLVPPGNPAVVRPLPAVSRSRPPPGSGTLLAESLGEDER